ncbi:MAG: GNAT family protein [Bacteroidota bacterium]
MRSVREYKLEDIPQIASYWESRTEAELLDMGADPQKRPKRDAFIEMLTRQFYLPIQEKYAYCLIWEVDGVPVGHCNTNPTFFGDHAFMHLHMWEKSHRQKGQGTALVKMSIPYFFKNLQLQTLYCQPFSQNPAPNHTLKKVGFQFVKAYRTIPGSMNFEQEVYQWKIAKQDME